MNPSLFRRPFLLLLILATVAATGCARVSRQRTLPPSVRDVTVPMFINRSAEPGIEETATILTQKQFLSDGRLELVSQDAAHAIVQVVIKDFNNASSSFDSDDFPRRTRYTVEAEIKIIQNLPGKPVIGGTRTVRATWAATSDKRKITYEPEPDAKERLLEILAMRIVREVITGSWTEDA